MKTIQVDILDSWEEALASFNVRRPTPMTEQGFIADRFQRLVADEADLRKAAVAEDVARVLAKDPAAGEALLALRKQKDEEFALEVKKEADKVPGEVAAVEAAGEVKK